jgi:hypothetical protein
VAVQCTPPSNTLFPLGTTTVTCTAKDSSNNIATGSFPVTIVDTKPPVLSLPAPITVQAPSANGVAVTFSATAADIVSGNVPVSCSPSSGSTFGAGTTSVQCSATDGAGNKASGSFTVTVIAPADSTPPVLALPGNITVEATSGAGAAVSWTATAVDAVDGPVPVQCTPPSGSQFAIGPTPVTCSARDAANNVSGGSFVVTVRDTTPPTITSASATPNVLGPPNHKMIPVTVKVTATDRVDTAPVARIVGVSSNEPQNGLGDGDTGPDWVVTGPLTVSLRAERSGKGSGRVYTIDIEVRDRHGNASRHSVLVRVLK